MVMTLLQEVVCFNTHSLHVFICETISCKNYGALLLLSDIQEQILSALVSFHS
jgi:hypothetical protein